MKKTSEDQTLQSYPAKLPLPKELERLLQQGLEQKRQEGQARGLKGAEEERFLASLRARVAPFWQAAGHLFALSGPKDPTPYHFSLVRGVLAKELGREPEREEVDHLAGTLLKRMKQAKKALAFEGATFEQVWGLASEEGMLWLDARAARFFGPLGDVGTEFAEEIRTRAAARYADYLRARGNATLADGLDSPEWRAVWELLWAKEGAALTPLRFAWHLARAIWFDDVKEDLEQRRRRHVRTPTDIAKTFALARGNQTTLSLCDLTQRVIVQSRDGLQLFLPIDGVQCGGEVELRRTLSGGAMKTYFAAWALWCDEGARADGTFKWEERRVHEEYLGTRKNKYGQAGGVARQLLKQNFEQLLDLGVAGVTIPELGTVRARHPEPLIQHYYLNRPGDLGPNLYRHAPLLITAMSQHFVQIPRAVLRLSAHDVPLAVGLAVLLRRHALEILRGPGYYQAPLQEVLLEIGENYTQGTRKAGKAYWTEIAEKLKDTAKEGALGEIRLVGEGPETKVILTMNQYIGDAYQHLPQQAAAHAKDDQKAKREAKVRNLLTSKKGNRTP